MSKKEWAEKAEQYLHDVLELLQMNEETGYIGQEPYKSDFFWLFARAYRTGFCTVGVRFDKETKRVVPCKSQCPLVNGDAIWSYAKKHGWVHAEMEPEEKRYRDIDMVQTWWDEWTYAWDRNPPPRIYQRSDQARRAGRK